MTRLNVFSAGMTTGTPIHVFVPNTDQRGGVSIQYKIYNNYTHGRAIIVGTDPFVAQSYLVPQDYTEMAKAYRPSHADLTYDLKYGVRSVQVPVVIHI